MYDLEVIDREIAALTGNDSRYRELSMLRSLKRKYSELNQHQSPERSKAMENILSSTLDVLDRLNKMSKEWKKFDDQVARLKELVKQFKNRFEW